MSGKLEYRKILRFPNLELTEYQVTSEETVDYNCFAFAAGEEECRWDPVDPGWCFKRVNAGSFYPSLSNYWI
jgi:hypothetical protein